MKKTLHLRHLVRAMVILLALSCDIEEIYAQIAPPYKYGFENNDLATEGWCIQNGEPGTGIFDFSFASSKEGNNSFIFVSGATSPQYLISPRLNVTSIMTLSFWFLNFNLDFSETFQVGYSTTDNEVSHFTWESEIKANDATKWTQFKGDFPIGTTYIAIRYNSKETASLHVDKIEMRVSKQRK